MKDRSWYWPIYIDVMQCHQVKGYKLYILETHCCQSMNCNSTVFREKCLLKSTLGWDSAILYVDNPYI